MTRTQLLLVTVFTLLVALSCSAIAQTTAFICGGTAPDSVQAAKREIVKEKSILTAGVIYVTFPGSAPGDTIESPAGPPAVVTQAMRDVLSGYDNFISLQSDNAVDLQMRIIAGPNENERVWVADYPAIMYTAQYVNSIRRYYDYWFQFIYPYTGELQAEVLFKIITAYENEADPNPFAGLDNLVIIPCLADSTPDPLPCGLGSLAVRCDDVVGAPGIPYGDTMCTGSSLTAIWGCTFSWRNTSEFMANGAGQTLTHEYGHVLGFGDHKHSPPGEDVYLPGDQAIPPCGGDCGALLDCYYGNYDVMYGWIRANHPFNPYIYYDLQTIGWLPSRQVITESTRNLRIYDLRRGGHVVSVQFSVSDSWPSNPVTELRWLQYFDIAYHSRTDEDAYIGGDGLPTYPSSGLAVWHAPYIQYNVYGAGWVTASEPQYLDIESAFGLYSDPGPLGNPSYWQSWDLESGFDNLDTWGSRDPICAMRDGAEASSYLGSASDFFSSLTNTEFSYRSNPNTYGYDLMLGVQNLVQMESGCDPPMTWVYNNWRNLPQDQANSLVIKIKEEHPEANPPYVIVDIEFAPREEITSPTSGDPFAVDGVVPIRWSHDHNIINTCDIYFSSSSGADNYPIEVATGVEVSAGQYDWIPADDGVGPTSNGKIKIVWHNTNSDYVESSESDGTFHVVAPSIAKCVNGSAETGLNYSGNPYSAVGFEYYNDPANPMALTDLFVTTDGFRSDLFEAYNLSANEVPMFRNKTIVAFQTVDIRPQRLLGGISYADVDNDGDLDLFCASGRSDVPRMYKNDGFGHYTDVTAAMGLFDLTGPPPFEEFAYDSWAGVWGDYDGDGWIDLFIVRSVCSPTSEPISAHMGPDACYLMRNDEGDGFIDVTASAGLASAGANYTIALSASWVDVNDDHRLDLYLSCLGQPPLFNPPTPPAERGKLFVQQQTNPTTFVEESAARISMAIPPFLESACDFEDMNNDGYPDMIIGKEELEQAAYVIFNTTGPMGHGYFTTIGQITMPSIGGTSGLKVFDHDMDGRLDLLLTPWAEDTGVKLYSNRYVPWATVFVDETDGAGIEETPVGQSTKAGGIVAVDWNRDGDLDVLLGRPTSTNRFFYKTVARNGSEGLGRNRIMVRLSSPQGVNNAAGIGARVKIVNNPTYGTMTRWVDGGSGRGGQDDLVLSFPVSQSSGTVPVYITWPNGWIQQANVPVAVTGAPPFEILDNTNPSVVNSTVVGGTSYDPETDRHYWLFTWETEYRSDKFLDSVTVYSSACVPTTTTYTGSSGIEPVITRLPSGRYLHEFRVHVNCNAPCAIPFAVSSSHRAGITSTSTQKRFKILFCPSQL